MIVAFGTPTLLALLGPFHVVPTTLLAGLTGLIILGG